MTRTPPPKPEGLPTPVRREWRRVVAELQARDLPMPAADVLADHCRILVWHSQVCAALDAEPAGTIKQRRLITIHTELSKQIAQFCAEYISEMAALLACG